MSKQQDEGLHKLLPPFSTGMQEITIWLRSFVWNLYPGTNEPIYDKCNTLAFGCSPTDCAITKSISAVQKKRAKKQPGKKNSDPVSNGSFINNK